MNSTNKSQKAFLSLIIICSLLFSVGCSASKENYRYDGYSSDNSTTKNTSTSDSSRTTHTSSTTQGENISTDTPTSEDPSTSENFGFDSTTLDETTGKDTPKNTTKSPDTTKTPTTTKPEEKPTVPTPAPAELRGVWINYLEVANLLKTRNATTVKIEIDKVMATVKENGFNTVFFHARANSDAFYKSAHFKAATGVNDLLSSGLDPLTYAVESAHKQGLRIEAWVNPYRIGTDQSYAKLSGNDVFSITSTENGKSVTRYYYNPGSPACQKLIVDGVAEIVQNYNVDGVQFDDYFYPNNSVIIPRNKAAGFEEGFYKDSGMSIGDWRFNEVNKLVKSVYSKVHSIKNQVVFGISPRALIDQNYDLYADAQTWIKNSGYVDYILPQIYYGFENQKAPFMSVLNNWAKFSRHSSVRLYAGLPLYKSGLEDTYSGTTGRKEFIENSNLIKRMIENVRNNSAYTGIAVYTYGDLNASTSTTKGKEVANMKSVLR